MGLYSYYKNLFERLNVKQSNKVAQILLFDDYEFYNRYIITRNNEIRQIGGNKTKQLEYKFEGYTFIIQR